MPINIKSRSTKTTGSKSGTTSTRSRSTSRSTGTTRSRSTSKTTGRSTSTRKPAETQATEPTPRAAKAPEGMTNAELRKMISKAEKLGATREAKREAWDAAVEEIHEFAAEMLAAGVSMAVVSRATGISRQWLYKIAEKVNGSTTTKAKSNGRKTAAKKPATKRAAKKPAARSTSKASSKTTSTRRSTRGTSKPAARRGGIKLRSGR